MLKRQQELTAEFTVECSTRSYLEACLRFSNSKYISALGLNLNHNNCNSLPINSILHYLIYPLKLVEKWGPGSGDMCEAVPILSFALICLLCHITWLDWCWWSCSYSLCSGFVTKEAAGTCRAQLLTELVYRRSKRFTHHHNHTYHTKYFSCS